MTDLGSQTWPEAEAAADAVLLIPLGATEQHGPHLPLDTDSRIAAALAERAAAGAAERDRHIVVAHTHPYGSSGEHAGFAGTLSIGREATELLLVELCRSACETFDRVVLVNAHGGNAVPVERAVRRLRDEGRDVRAWSPRWGGDAHAGRVETSLMLAISPELVRLDRAESGNIEPVASMLGDLVASGIRPLSPNGVLGDPAGASAAEGRELLEAVVDDLLSELWRLIRPTRGKGATT